MYIKLNFQLSEAGENSPLEPYKNKREAQRDTGWSLEDCISVNEKALCTHLPRHGKYLLACRWNYFIGNTERQAVYGGDGGEGGDSHEDLVPAQRALVVSLKRCSLQAALISAQMARETEIVGSQGELPEDKGPASPGDQGNMEAKSTAPGLNTSSSAILAVWLQEYGM